MERFGKFSFSEISQNIDKSEALNTKRSKAYVWSQFMSFCELRNYTFDAETPDPQLACILTDWAYNMRKTDGEDYKEGKK